MNPDLPSFAQNISDATTAVFGETPLTQAVLEACQRYAKDLENIQSGRGINALLIAIVGAKGQGKTWSARQFVRDDRIKSYLRSGDLTDDATTRLVWIGPVPPDGLEPETEIYYPCSANQLAKLGPAYVLLDTPGLTDINSRAAKLAEQSLSLAPVKLLVIARDQIRAAVNMVVTRQIDGSECIPIITSVEPEEMPGGKHAETLAEDLRSLRQQLEVMAPRSNLHAELLIPDFEITGDESAASQVFLSGILDRFNDLTKSGVKLDTARERRSQAAAERLTETVARLFESELPQLQMAVDQLHRETEHLPERVLQALLGSQEVLATGVRMRLRARLVSDTSLLWFPYRTLMSTLNLTQGAWDRVMLALTGSVPSLFGALASWARNVKQTRDFNLDVEDGVRRRTQQQVEERLRPLCDQFHRTVLKLRPRDERMSPPLHSATMRLSGIEDLQNRSRQIFESAIEQNATASWLVQLLAVVGVVIFWIFMAGPIVLIYREYFAASVDVLSGGHESRLEDFPHPTAGLIFTSLILSLLPLAIYCMVVLTVALSKRKVQRVARRIVDEHQRTIDELKTQRIIRLEFEDPLLQQAEFLLGLRNS